ncbi:MAG: class B sortase [Lachnospiraceae bacterium]|nr:class B sortase [Lachnospiraceae bacterium]
MAVKTYIVEGRQFRTEADYKLACRDQQVVEKLRERIKGADSAALAELKKELADGKYEFYTLVGQDFMDEVDEKLKKASHAGTGKPAVKKSILTKRPSSPQKAASAKKTDKELEPFVREELKRRERNRKLLILFCSIFAAGCLGYFGVYSYYNYRTDATYKQLDALKEQANEAVSPALKPSAPVIHYDADKETPEVLEEYKNLLNKNQKLIGWLKIDDTNINYPVMQTSDNDYYQDHNLNQEYDKNGSIFMDKDCDVLKPSTNFILYGHHMKSGQMFGDLDKYEDKKYAEAHPYIDFDTIYEHGIYRVMYVFRSRVYNEEEITFKYYQFIDALSEKEFDSYMEEMAELSLYDTGITAQFGDQLLTLSTCDYQEKNGRFVVVAKKVAAKEY